MAEAVSHRPELHVVHGHEGGGDDEVEDPLEGDGDGRGLAADGVREELGDVHPADRTPAEHEARAVHHDGEGSDEGRERAHVREGDAQGADRHAQRTGDEERLAAQLLHREHRDEGERDVDHAHDDREEHVVRHAHRLEDARGEIEHRVDADGLLEHAEHAADEDDQPAVGEQLLGLLHGGRLDVREDFASLGFAVDVGQHREGLLVLPVEGEETRRLRDEEDEQGEQAGRDALGHEHHTPAHGIGPFHHRGIVRVRADDQEVHEVHDQLAEDDRELVPGHERAPLVRGRHLGDVHRAQGRCEAHAHAAEHAVQVEGHEEALRRDALLKEEELRAVGAQGAQEEHDTGAEQGLLAAQAGRHEAREECADDAADEGARGRESVPAVGVGEVAGALEERLQALLRTGNHRRIVPEQQAADDGDEDNRKQVAWATCLSVTGHNAYLA